MNKVDELLYILNPFAKNSNDMVDFCMDCIIDKILNPRFGMRALLGNMLKIMKNEGNFDNKALKDVKKEITNWVMRGDNKFDEKVEIYGIPHEIDDIFERLLGKSTSYYINIYQDELDQEEIKMKIIDLQNKWISPELVEKLVKTKKRELSGKTGIEDDWKYTSRSQSFNPMHTKTYAINRETGEIDEGFQKIADKIEKRNLTGISENISEDKERFEKIFEEFEKYTTVIDEVTRNLIKHFWYGDYYNKDNSNMSDNFINYTHLHNIKIKITNISQEVSRAVLQTYITGIILGKDVKTIYSVIREILKKGSYDSRTINPNRIYNKNFIPDKDIQNIFDPVFERMNINPSISVLRTNWNNLKFPKILIKKLIDSIENDEKMNKGEKFIIKVHIIMISREQKKSITIEKFADKIYKTIQKFKLNTVRQNITKNKIKDLLKYV